MCQILRMAVHNSVQQTWRPVRPLAQWIRQAGLFVLLGVTLVSQRLRHLRHRVWTWSLVRLAVAACATWLGWRYKRGRRRGANAYSVVAFIRLQSARQREARREPGGSAGAGTEGLRRTEGRNFLASLDSVPVAPALIAVCADQIAVVGPHEERLLEIPQAMLSKIQVRSESGDGAPNWVVEITWMADTLCTSQFQYQGTFAEYSRESPNTPCAANGSSECRSSRMSHVIAATPRTGKRGSRTSRLAFRMVVR